MHDCLTLSEQTHYNNLLLVDGRKQNRKKSKSNNTSCYLYNLFHAIYILEENVWPPVAIEVNGQSWDRPLTFILILVVGWVGGNLGPPPSFYILFLPPPSYSSQLIHSPPKPPPNFSYLLQKGLRWLISSYMKRF